MEPKKIEVMFEFLVFGIVIGIVEDLLAIKLATGERITLQTIGIIVLLAIPFAIIGELVADRVDFVKIYKKFNKK
ncbi:MAG: hypothetical protein GF370_01940 [Candidatus Nealsonbacteria bacterium]|nr:hypothetical protein [Candidatus Nealsonbacteria bacterium]